MIRVAYLCPMIRHIPNAFTLANLLCGCIALVCLFEDAPHLVPYFVAAAVIFDVFDGMIARMLHINSEIGKQLDSLADMVTFGFLPGAIMFKMISASMGIENLPPDEYLRQPALWFSFIGFSITLFSALRLAKFNLDARQSDGFIGLPTPSSTLFVMGLMMIWLYGPYSLRPYLNDNYILSLISVVLSYLLIAELPMFSLKFKNFGWKGNEERYLGLLLATISFVVLKHAALALNVFMYVLYSAGKYAFQMASKKSA